MLSRFPFHSFIRSRPHLTLAIVLGAAAWPLLPDDWSFSTRLLSAWNIAVWIYLVTMGSMMMRADHHRVKQIAARQDERAPVVLAGLSVASVMSLVAVFSQLSGVNDMSAHERALHYGFTLLTLLGSWFLLGTLFCFHYAHLYYLAEADKRPLLFPGNPEEPNYWDFLYFAFTLSVAVQTSDVQVMTRDMRKLVLGQSVLCFFFNLVVLGLSVNLAAGLINA